MSLRVLKYVGTPQSGTVFVTSDTVPFSEAISEITSMKSKQMAVDYAASEGHIGKPSISGSVVYYAIDDNGAPVTDATANPIVAYVGEIPVMHSLL